MSKNDSSSSLPTVSVVVPTYNRRDFLPNTLPPLLADPAATEVIVVVDGCRDGSLEYLQNLAEIEPRLRVLFIENHGQTAAQEAGLNLAIGEVVLLIDDDVIPASGLVTGHAQHHAGVAEIVVVGYMPTRIPAERTASAYTTVLYAREYERAAQRYLDEPDDILRGLWMGNVSLRAGDCRRVGLYNPAFGSIAKFYHVDRDFGLRCLMAGLVGVHDRELLGEHVLVRALPSFLKNSRAQGVGLVGLHRLHGDIIGPFSIDSITNDVPSPARQIVRATRHHIVYRSLIGSCSTWIRIAGRLRFTALQLPAAKLVRKAEQLRGARDALEETSPT